MTKRTNQGGSVVAFIIVGVLLVAAFVEGIYLVRWRGGQLAKQPTSSKQSQSSKDTAKTKPEKESAPKSEVGADKPATNNVTVEPDDTSGSVVLPTTGAEIDLVSYLGLFVLTFIVSSYLASRKQKYSRL